MNWSEHFAPLLKIVVTDIVLSGDNAVVIAMAAYRLPPVQRRWAVVLGTGGAIVLRVIFTVLVATLLNIPLLRLAGGLVLVWISMKLLVESEEPEQHHVHAAGNLLQAIRTIVVADAIMSLDNMLAVGGASEGNIPLIVFGLLLSIAIIMTCSTFVAWAMQRYPALVYLGAGVLAWTAGEMILDDSKVIEFGIARADRCWFGEWHELSASHLREWTGDSHPALVHQHWVGWVLLGALIVVVVSYPRLKRHWARQTGSTGAATASAPNDSRAAPEARLE
jgi:YjbE family integral membrane protein